MKNLLRSWLPIVFAFAIGWAVQVYWPGQAKDAKAASHARGPAANSPSPFTVNHANDVQNKDAEPKLVPWSAESALGKILATNRGGLREMAIAGLVNQTPVDKLGALIDEARFCTDDDAKSTLLSLAYAKWAALDPQAALAFARTAATKRYDRDSGPMTEVLATWAGHDPQAALAAAQSLDLASFRQDGIRAVLQAWAQTDDPQGAVAAAKALGLGTQLSGTLSAIYQGWAQHDPAGAFAALGSIDNLNIRNSVAGSILQTMADTDPKGALTLFQTLSPGTQNSDAESLNYIFSRLTMADPHSALDALSQVPTGNLHQRAITCIACDWGDSDPQGALAWASSLANPADRDNALYNAVRHTATSDPAMAANDLKMIPDVNQRNQAMSEVLGNYVNADPAGALKWVQQNTTGTTQTMAMSQVVSSIAQMDPLAALGVVKQSPDSPNYNNMVFQTLNTWSQSDPAAALDWAKSNLSGNDLNTATTIATRQLINMDPAAGAQYVTAMPEGPNRDNLVSQVANSMAKLDMDGALNWLGNVSGIAPNVRNNAMENVMSQLAQTDPQAAASKLATINFDPGTSTNGAPNAPANSPNYYANAASQIASNWAQTDPTAALNWAMSLDPASGQSAVSSAIGSIANNDPATAWNDVMNMAASGNAGGNIQGLETTVINAYSRQDPASAVSLLGNLTPGQQNSVIPQIANNWLREDPYAASQWISTLNPGPAKDNAVQNLLNQQGQGNLSTSLQWVGTMSNEAAQTRGYTTVITQAARQDPAAAQVAVDNLQLTDAQRTQLNQIIQRSQNNPGFNNGMPDYGYGPGVPPPNMHFEYDSNGNQRLAPN